MRFTGWLTLCRCAQDADEIEIGGNMKTQIMYAVPFLHAKIGDPLDIEKSGAFALFSHRYTADDYFVDSTGLEKIVKVRVTIECVEKKKAKP